MQLLARTAHAAVIHPRKPHIILLFMGWGQKEAGGGPYTFLDDIVNVNTKT